MNGGIDFRRFHFERAAKLNSRYTRRRIRQVSTFVSAEIHVRILSSSRITNMWHSFSIWFYYTLSSFSLCVCGIFFRNHNPSFYHPVSDYNRTPNAFSHFNLYDEELCLRDSMSIMRWYHIAHSLFTSIWPSDRANESETNAHTTHTHTHISISQRFSVQVAALIIRIFTDKVALIYFESNSNGAGDTIYLDIALIRHKSTDTVIFISFLVCFQLYHYQIKYELYYFSSGRMKKKELPHFARIFRPGQNNQKK